MGKKSQEMLDDSNQNVLNIDVNQVMKWMNDENSAFVDVRKIKVRIDVVCSIKRL